jgi:hypothetical protein
MDANAQYGMMDRQAVDMVVVMMCFVVNNKD